MQLHKAWAAHQQHNPDSANDLGMGCNLQATSHTQGAPNLAGTPPPPPPPPQQQQQQQPQQQQQQQRSWQRAAVAGCGALRQSTTEANH
jgi:hypothetical protein